MGAFMLKMSVKDQEHSLKYLFYNVKVMAFWFPAHKKVKIKQIKMGFKSIALSCFAPFIQFSLKFFFIMYYTINNQDDNWYT